MAYRRILETSQLPPVGPLGEDLRFDMKMQLRDEVMRGERPPQDLAGDVAAFANAMGGVLLVGAKEDDARTGILERYEPLTWEDVDQVVKLFDQARKLCSPVPVAEAKPLPLADGSGYAVAVNCDAYAAPPIGVKLANQQGGEKSWSFPVRRGQHTHHLRPEEIATIMEPRHRRLTLLLDAMVQRQPPGVPPYPKVHFRGSPDHDDRYFLQKIDRDNSVIHLRPYSEPIETQRTLAIPLDLILAVWEDGLRGGTNSDHIAVDGRVSGWVFRPTGV